MSGSIVIDTSVWVGHFRHHSAELAGLIESDLALMHPMVLLELSCGTPPAPRARTLNDLALLQPARQASLEEIAELIERESLYGLGCGLVDIALLASALITPGARLWTLDRPLRMLAQRFDVGHALGLR